MLDFDIPIYFVGTDKDNALADGFPWIDKASAQDWADDHPGTKVYRVSAFVDLSTWEEA